MKNTQSSEFNQASAYLERAAMFVAKASPAALEQALLQSLQGAPPADFRPPSRLTEPVDIFLDLYDAAPEGPLAQRIRSAAVKLLEQKSAAPPEADKQATFELAYLAARTGAAGAIEPLTTIATDPRSAKLLNENGETLHMRALRCLAGLLLAYPAAAGQKHREILEAAAGTSGGEQVLGLSTLIALWPAEEQTFRALAQNVDQKKLSFALRLNRPAR